MIPQNNYNSNITGHHNLLIKKKFEILQELPKCDTGTQSKWFWNSGADRLARHNVAVYLQLKKKKLYLRSTVK